MITNHVGRNDTTSGASTAPASWLTAACGRRSSSASWPGASDRVGRSSPQRRCCAPLRRSTKHGKLEPQRRLTSRRRTRPGYGGTRAEERITTIVRHVAGDAQAEIGHVEGRAVGSVRITCLDNDQPSPLEIDFGRIERLGEYDRVAKLAGKPRRKPSYNAFGLVLFRISSTLPVVATTRALEKRSSRTESPRK
jgi:hypothetical protein